MAMNQNIASCSTLRAVVKDGQITFTGDAARKVASACRLYLETRWGGELYTSFPAEKDWRYFPVLVAAGYKLAIINY